MSKNEHLAQLRGKVLAFNISPKGHFEGAMIETSQGAVQINFPRHAAEELAGSMQIGSEVDLQGELSNEEHAHPVYRVDHDGQEIEVGGVIASLNYALHGEVNGFRFEDGSFVHLKPEGARRYEPLIGESVIAVGFRRVGSDAVVLEARSMQRPVNRDGASA